jgi:SHS2 domain-containing protein
LSYRWVEHTAELEMEIEAPTQERVFVDALVALAELLGDGRRGVSVLREIAIGGRGRAVLLVEWLDELVYIAETEDLVPEDAVRIEFHRLAFEPSEHGFRARVVLDV